MHLTHHFQCPSWSDTLIFPIFTELYSNYLILCTSDSETDLGVERGVRLEGLTEKQISKALEDLVKVGESLKAWWDDGLKWNKIHIFMGRSFLWLLVISSDQLCKIIYLGTEQCLFCSLNKPCILSSIKTANLPERKFFRALPMYFLIDMLT